MAIIISQRFSFNQCPDHEYTFIPLPSGIFVVADIRDIGVVLAVAVFLEGKALVSVGKKNYSAIDKAALFQQVPYGNVVSVRVDSYVLEGGNSALGQADG